jgi:hypothetical protein
MHLKQKRIEHNKLQKMQLQQLIEHKAQHKALIIQRVMLPELLEDKLSIKSVKSKKRHTFAVCLFFDMLNTNNHYSTKGTKHVTSH